MKGKFDLGSLSGILMKRAQPVLRFAFKDGFLTDKEVLNAKLLPFDMLDEVCQRTIENFFWYRVTPLTRQGLEESLKEYGIPANYEAMIRAGSGHCIHDDYYLESI
jgi:hypothetical protein